MWAKGEHRDREKKGRKVMEGRDAKPARVHLIDDGRRERFGGTRVERRRFTQKKG